MPCPALLTDLYELTMLAGYLDNGMAEVPATFDLFFRQNPFHGGYAVFAGLDPALSYLEHLRFSEEDLRYLNHLGIFRPAFMDYLREFRFRGTVYAPPEGTVVFANEPLLTVVGPLGDAQFVETALLNIVNFQTLVATKAARLTRAAGTATVMEFGLRRAQGPDGGLSAARGAFIGGVRVTSDVEAGRLFGIPVQGTHAHSWVMAFNDELTAFRRYADVFPDTCTLLVDTYETLTSGLPNAITVARELRAKGHELRGVRIDSGDLAYLSREARRLLDQAGFPGVRIVASNELDEEIIASMNEEGGKVDIYGVGTKLATCMGEGGGALGGVYKLVRIGAEPKLKVTSDAAKATLPGLKTVVRAATPDGIFLQDIMTLEGENLTEGETVYDPANPLRHLDLPPNARFTDLRSLVLEKGERVSPSPRLEEMAERCADQLRRLPQGCLRLVNPHRYKVSISKRLNDLRIDLIEKIRRGCPEGDGGGRDRSTPTSGN